MFLFGLTSLTVGQQLFQLFSPIQLLPIFFIDLTIFKHKKIHFSTSDQKQQECPRGSNFLLETAIVPIKSGAYRTPSDRKTSITLQKMKQSSFCKKQMVRNRLWMTKNELRSIPCIPRPGHYPISGQNRVKNMYFRDYLS